MSFVGIQPTAGAILITHSNLKTGILHKNQRMLDNVKAWHKFIVDNPGRWERNEVLSAILDYVFPLDLIPVAFGRDQFGCFFLARNCAAAIKKLCNNNLTVPNPYNESLPFRLTIVLKFSTTQHIQVEVQKNITEVLRKRYDPDSKILNLTKFHEDPDLVEFCPLFQPKVLYYVLHLTEALTPHPETYILNECRIRLLDPFDALAATNVYNVVKVISLCGNLLEEVSVLEPLKCLKLHGLMLEGNPLCGKYNSCSEYIYEVNKVLPTLEMLDGVVIKVADLPASRQVFLCNNDGLESVNQFIEYYFTLYDSTSRLLLQSLYRKNSLFSLNTAFHPNQIAVNKTSLVSYLNVSRNLIKLADFSKAAQYLYKGSQQIGNRLRKLPRTQHDPYSFKVDLICHTDQTSIICVSGVFREMPQNSLSPVVFGFSRTFVLSTETKQDGVVEYYISNELLHVYNALIHQHVTAFSHGLPPHLRKTKPPPAVPKTEKERLRTVDALKAITGLSEEWAKKFLDDCRYDLKKSLSLFVHLYQSDKLPQEAFVKR